MNKQLKFRIWNKKYNLFTTDYAIHNSGDILRIDVGHSYVISKEDLVIQRFTGLQDKNGKDIYEGDILSQGPTYKPYVVEYNDRIGAFTGGMFRFNGEGMSIRTVSLEIIGNIFANPELVS